MKKIVCLIACIMAFATTGCSTIAESVLGNVGGADITACLRGPSVCTELFLDNYDRFNGEPEE